MKQIWLSAVLVLLTACSTVQQFPPRPPVEGASTTSPTTGQSNIPAQVEVGLADEIGNNGGGTPQLLANEETVRLGDRGGDIFMPDEGSAPIGEGGAKRLRIGFSLGPGLYRTINYVSLLKVL